MSSTGSTQVEKRGRRRSSVGSTALAGRLKTVYFWILGRMESTLLSPAAGQLKCSAKPIWQGCMQPVAVVEFACV